MTESLQVWMKYGNHWWLGGELAGAEDGERSEVKGGGKIQIR